LNINNLLPNSYNITNRSSKRARKINFQLFGLNLFLIFAGILCELVDPQNLNVVAGILSLGGSVTTIFLGFKQFEKKWYNSRALAESIKTLAWKYAVGGHPFDISLNDEDVRLTFLQNIRDLTIDNKDFRELVNPSSVENHELTIDAEECRKLNLSERKTIYLEQRIKEQKTWYISKSNKYKNVTWWYIGLIIFSETLSAFFSFLMHINFPVSVLLANFTFILFSLLQAKQFRELSQAYFVTALDIQLIEEKYARISSENEFTQFVDEAELAFSREHILWLARRDAELIHTKIKD